MNRQDVFNRVVLNLRAQGATAVCLINNRAECQYRTNHVPPRKCAIGGLIPDEKYNPSMETNSVEDLLRRFPEIREDLGGPSGRSDTEFLQELQFMHDRADNLELAFSNAAVLLGLTVPA